MANKKFLACNAVWALIFLIFPLIASTQSTLNQIVKGYFRNPIGLPMEIVANMGELRPNHWHMGLDIRTNQKVNQAVYAAAEGYIAHVGIRPLSFGRFIIINHPNGLSTLYAHLNNFFPELEAYVTGQQYLQESWAIELGIPRTKFPVTRGQFISYSGTTGGSQGPHLHFEIFDTKTSKRLNPLLFGFPLKDNVAPNIVKLAMYDRTKSITDQSPQLFFTKKTDSGYILPKAPVIRTGSASLSFATQAYDRISGSNNADGIFSAKLFLDEQPLLSFVIDSIDYDATGYMNAHIDYKYKYNGGAYLQHLSRLPGDKGGIYKPIEGDGIILLEDTAIHSVRVELADAYKNRSELNFLIQFDSSLEKKIIPQSAVKFVPNEINVFEKPDFELYLPETCIYDTVSPFYFKGTSSTANSVSASHRINDESIPVHGEISVRILPDRFIPNAWNGKLVMQRSGRKKSAQKAERQGEWFAAKFSDFGTFQLFIDSTPPLLNGLGRGDTINLSGARYIQFTPTDNFGIKSFRAELNGSWLRFTNDKGRTWTYAFDDRCPYGTHHLRVMVEDIAGNVTTKNFWIKRGPYKPPKKKKVYRKKRK